MVAIIEAMAPLFALIAIGAVLGHLRVLEPTAAVAVLNRFVYWVALPPVLFLAPLRLPSSAGTIALFVLAYGTSALVTYALAYLLGRSAHAPKQRAIAGMTASFGNTGYMGVPLFLILLGQDQVFPAALATLFNTVVLIPLTAFLLERERPAAAGGPLSSLRRAAFNPLAVSSIAGIVTAGLGLELPEWLWHLGDSLGGATAPCTLVAIGLSIAAQHGRMSVTGLRAASAMKLLLQPIVAWIVGLAIGLEGLLLLSAVLLAAMPTGSLVFVLAQQFGVRENPAAAAVLYTTLASLATLPLIFLLFP